MKNLKILIISIFAILMTANINAQKKSIINRDLQFNKLDQTTEIDSLMVLDANKIMSRVNYTDVLNKIQGDIVSPASSEAVQVGAEWVSGLTFDVTADRYPIGSNYFTSTQANVILDPSDATLDRIDLLVAVAPIFPATIGTVDKITGIPSATPSAPDFDPSLVYPIKFVLVNATATIPNGFANENVFDENLGTPTEWNATSTANIVTNSINDAYSGTISVEATNTTYSDKTTFTNDVTTLTNDLSSLSFWLKLKENMSSSYIFVKFYNGSSRVGSTYLFRNGQNGFDSSNLSWQKITIEGNKLNLPSGNFDGVQIYPFKNSYSGYFIDLVNIQDGNTVVVSPSGIAEAPNNGVLYGRKDSQWSEITSVTKTSDLTNDGEDGINPFITENDVNLTDYARKDQSNDFLVGQNIKYLGGSISLGQLAGLTEENIKLSERATNTNTTNPRDFDLQVYGSQVSSGWNGALNIISGNTNIDIARFYANVSNEPKVDIFGDLTVSGGFIQSKVLLTGVDNEILKMTTTVNASPNSIQYEVSSSVGSPQRYINTYARAGGGPGWHGNQRFYVKSNSSTIDHLALKLTSNDDNDVLVNAYGQFEADKYFVSSLNTAPTTASDTGTTGEIRYTSDFIYICVATNVWKRSAISTW